MCKAISSFLRLLFCQLVAVYYYYIVLSNFIVGALLGLIKIYPPLVGSLPPPPPLTPIGVRMLGGEEGGGQGAWTRCILCTILYRLLYWVRQFLLYVNVH